MKVNIDNVIATTLFSGFGNFNVQSGSQVIASQLIASGSFAHTSVVLVVDGTNNMTQIQVQYDGIDGFWRLLPGVSIVDYPDAGAASYQIQTISSFAPNLIDPTKTSLFVDSYIINETGGIITFPGMTLRARVWAYRAPF